MVKCPVCGKEASFIKDYNRYYCYNCKQYLVDQSVNNDLNKSSEDKSSDNEGVLIIVNWLSFLFGLWFVPLILFFASKNPRVKKHARIAMIITLVMFVLLFLLFFLGSALIMGSGDLLSSMGTGVSEGDVALVNLLSSCQNNCNSLELLISSIPAQTSGEILALADFCCHSNEAGSCFEYYSDCSILDSSPESFCISQDYDFSVNGNKGVCPSTTYCCGVLPE